MEMTRAYDEVDISTGAFWELTAEERDERLALLRKERPVSWQRPAVGVGSVPGLEGAGYWAVLRHADVMTVSRDPETYSSAQGYMIEEIPIEILENAGSFLGMDHPRHTQMRRLVSQAFSPRRVRVLEEKIAARARMLVDELLARGEGDFVKTVAMPLPSLTYAEMVGVDEEDRERIVALADNMVAYNDPDALAGRDGLTLLMETLIGIYAEAAALVERRRTDPGEDILTGLVEAELDGQRLTEEEIAAFLVLVSVAANDTTRNSISHGMLALQRFPDQLELLRADLEARLPGAIEEIIRWGVGRRRVRARRCGRGPGRTRRPSRRSSSAGGGGPAPAGRRGGGRRSFRRARGRCLRRRRGRRRRARPRSRLRRRAP